MNQLSRRDYIAAMILASLAPSFPRIVPGESAAATRQRMARAALAIATTYIQEADNTLAPLGVPCPNQLPLDF